MVLIQGAVRCDKECMRALLGWQLCRHQQLPTWYHSWATGFHGNMLLLNCLLQYFCNDSYDKDVSDRNSRFLIKVFENYYMDFVGGFSPSYFSKYVVFVNRQWMCTGTTPSIYCFLSHWAAYQFSVGRLFFGFWIIINTLRITGGFAQISSWRLGIGPGLQILDSLLFTERSVIPSN